MKTLPLKLKIYLLSVYAITIFSFIYFVSTKYITLNIPDFGGVLFFTVLMGLTETFTVQYNAMSISTSFAVTMAAFILFGPLSTLIVVVLGFSLRIIKNERGRQHILNIPFYKTLYNYCVFVAPIIVGNYFYVKLGGSYSFERVAEYIIPLLIFSVTIYILNSLMMIILFSIINNKNIMYYILGDAKFTFVNALTFINIMAMAPFGVMTAFIFRHYSYGGVLLFIFPIILARFTLSQYIEAKTKYVQTVDVIMNALEARDKYTQGHSKRVAEIVSMIATELKYNEWKVQELNMASLLHDIGKIGIDDHILNKPGKLTAEEFDIIKKHPEIGFNILKDIKDLDYVKNIVKYHHERYDGKGYPDGRKPEELSLDVFIVQLADSIDAMSTDRPYRKAMSPEEVIEEIRKHSGTQFHPEVVDAYVRAFEKQRTA